MKAIAACLLLASTASRAAASGPAMSLDYSSTVLPLGYSQSQWFTYYPDGTSGAPRHLPGPMARWSSSAPGIVSISSTTGMMLGNRRGTAVIKASYNGLTASAAVTVAGAVTSTSIVTKDGRMRTYKVYTPDNMPAGPHPVVLAFHGGGGTGALIMWYSQMNVSAESHKFLAVYPDGVQGSWNAGACCSPATTPLHIDDVGFVSQLIDTLVAQNGADPTRVYSTGISNGGIMSNRLACQLSDKIAAIGPIAGGLDPGYDFLSCRPSRPIPVMEFHGTTDLHYQYLGGQGPDSDPGANFNPYATAIPYTTPSHPVGPPGTPETVMPSSPTLIMANGSAVSTTQDAWLAFDGVDRSSYTTTYQNGVESCVRHQSGTSVPVTLCTANPPAFETSISSDGSTIVWDGGGHAWPGGAWNLNPDADRPTQDINASDQLAQFFLSIVLDTAAPSVAIVSPSNGRAAAVPVIVSGTASDNVAVSSVAVSLDGGPYALAAGTTSWSLALGALADGSHTLQAKAWDSSGNASASPVVGFSVSEPSVDVGLRIFDGTQVIAVAAEPAGTLTSPLRVRAADGRVHGVELVDPADPAASSLRVQTPQGLKALRKF